MYRLRVGIVVVALFLLGAAYYQKPDDKKSDKKSDDKPDVKVRGQLPANFKKLGLRDDQVQKIYRIRMDYKAKLTELQRQIDKLKSDEKMAIENVLTPDQLKRLKELRSGEKSK